MTKKTSPFFSCLWTTTAGFSAEEPESGDEGAFLTDHTVKVSEWVLIRNVFWTLPKPQAVQYGDPNFRAGSRAGLTPSLGLMYVLQD